MVEEDPAFSSQYVLCERKMMIAVCRVESIVLLDIFARVCCWLTDLVVSVE